MVMGQVLLLSENVLTLQNKAILMHIHTFFCLVHMVNVV